MHILKCLADLPRDHPAYSIAAEILARIGPDEGYLVLIEPEDLDRDLTLPELPHRLDRVPWEGVSREGGYFHAVHLTNNEFGISFLIPDSVTGPLRSLLEEHL
jgi:hypothetical protein